MAGTAIKGRTAYMPRWLPKKTELQEKQLQMFSQKRQQNQVAFQQEIPIKERQELEVIIDDIGSRGDRTVGRIWILNLMPKTNISERLKVETLKVSRSLALAEKANKTGGEN